MRRTLITIVLIAACAAFTAPRAAAQSGDDTAAVTARLLLEKSGAGKLSLQIVEQMFSSFKKMLPNVPEEAWDEIMKEISAKDFIDMTVPIYVKHFTVAEMKAIIAFYETPAGAKMIAVMPEITRESYEVGNRWGKQLSQRVIERLRAKGYKVDQ